MNYAMITPVQNEEACLEQMIQSILAQHPLPDHWVFVDDGSTDATPWILGHYAASHPFIEIVSLKRNDARKPGGESVIDHALKRIALDEYDLLARFDADVVIEKDYMAKVIAEFEKDPALGIAGGVHSIETERGMREETNPLYHVRGGLKLYRRQCFEDIGGLENYIGWDTIDEIRAWVLGWKTRSFVHIRSIHKRPTGSGIPRLKLYGQRGIGEYMTCSHPAFVAAKAGKILLKTRSIGCLRKFVGSYCACHLEKRPRIDDPTFKELRHREQLVRLLLPGRSIEEFEPWKFEGKSKSRMKSSAERV